MPTENIKIESSEIYFKTEDGTIKEFKGATRIKAKNENELDMIKDFEKLVKAPYIEKNFEIKMTKESTTKLKKALGINIIKRKRFIKLLMGQKIQRNDAIVITNIVLATEGCYREYRIQQIIEGINKNKTFLT